MLRFITVVASASYFEEGFVKVSKTIINEKRIDSREQPLLANGFQTTGNLFSIQKELTRDIEKTIRHEVEKYRLHFENSKSYLFFLAND